MFLLEGSRADAVSLEHALLAKVGKVWSYREVYRGFRV